MWDGDWSARLSCYEKCGPPALARTYNSRAYPMAFDLTQGNVVDLGITGPPPIDQLTRHNILLQELEIEAYYSQKHVDYHTFRAKHSKLKPFYCKICSETDYLDTGKLRPTYHKHYASSMERMSAELDGFGRYVCAPCGPESEVHPIKFGARIPVVLSSSTLHKPFKGHFWGQSLHIDWCTITGGKTEDLAQAFKALYKKSCRPVDVLLVTGLNDINNNRTAEEIFQAYMRLKAMVLEVMPRHPTGRSTFAIASLPHPPIFSCYGGDIHTPVKNHNDRLLKLTELVVEHNRTASQDPFPIRKAPQFHKYGVKMRFSKTGEYGLRKIPSRHRYSQWREAELDKQLHLNNEKREKMALDCIRYFADIYGVCTCLKGFCLC